MVAKIRYAPAQHGKGVDCMKYGHAKPWLGLLNKALLQWFFIRLAVILEVPVTKNSRVKKLKILRWIVPMTGWGSKPYRKIGRGNCA